MARPTTLGFAPIDTIDPGMSGFQQQPNIIRDESNANPPAVQSNPDPYNLTPDMSPEQSFLPKSPLERLGVRLMNISRGAQGQELYSNELLRMQAQQEEMEYNRLRIGVDALGKGMELMQNTPADQQEAVARKFGGMFSKVLGDDFADTLLAAKDSPEKVQQLTDTFGSLGQTAVKLAGNTAGAMRLLNNPAWVKQMQDINVDRQGPYVMHAFGRVEEMAKKDPQFAADWTAAKEGGITLAELQKVAPVIGLNSDMLSAIRHSPELQSELRQYGFLPTADADLEAKAAIEARNKKITPKTTTVEEGGRKFLLAVNPADGKELWRVNAGVAQSQGGSRGKTTASDIRAAVALRLRGKDPAQAGLSPGAAAATDGLDETQLMALDAGLQGGGMQIEVDPKTGKVSMITGSMRSQEANREAKAEKDMQDATESVLKMVNLSGRVREMISQTPDSTNFGGTVARAIDNFSADVVGTARTLGVDVTKNLGLSEDDPDKLTTLDPAKAPDALFGDLAGKSAAFKTAVFQLALADAAANGQEGRGLSDKDLAASIRKVGGDVSSVGQLTAKLDEIENQHYDNLRLKFQTRNFDPSTGKAPPFMSLDDMRKRARGEDVAPAGQQPAAEAPPGGEALPAAARAKLVEGKQVKFVNGQVWTLRNGEPVRVQ